MAITIHDHSFQWHKKGGEVVVFEASNQDLADSTFQYFGYISSASSWLIQRFHIQGSTVIYSYFAGQTRADYDDQWNASGRYIGSLTFVSFDTIGDNL